MKQLVLGTSKSHSAVYPMPDDATQDRNRRVGRLGNLPNIKKGPQRLKNVRALVKALKVRY